MCCPFPCPFVASALQSGRGEDCDHAEETPGRAGVRGILCSVHGTRRGGPGQTACPRGQVREREQSVVRGTHWLRRRCEAGLRTPWGTLCNSPPASITQTDIRTSRARRKDDATTTPRKPTTERRQGSSEEETSVRAPAPVVHSRVLTSLGVQVGGEPHGERERIHRRARVGTRRGDLGVCAERVGRVVLGERGRSGGRCCRDRVVESVRAARKRSGRAVAAVRRSRKNESRTHESEQRDWARPAQPSSSPPARARSARRRRPPPRRSSPRNSASPTGAPRHPSRSPAPSSSTLAVRSRSEGCRARCARRPRRRRLQRR